jgi:hypothetical protein
MTIRREGKEKIVKVVPVSARPGQLPNLGGVWTVPRENMVLNMRAPTIPDVAMLPDLRVPPPKLDLDKLHVATLPSGWLGVGLKCEVEESDWDDDKEKFGWRFKNPPEIYMVEPDGPADNAGLEPGDVLTHINDVRLDSDEGSRLFSELEPGDTVTWKFRREDGTHSASFAAAVPPREEPVRSSSIMILGDDSDSAVVIPPGYSVARRRYSGSLGGTGIEIRGKNPVVVSVVEENQEMLVIVGDTTIRLWDKGKADQDDAAPENHKE